MRGITLLEFLVAFFLATLLLIVIYQAFGEVALFFRLAKQPSRSLVLEEILFQYQLTHLRGIPTFMDDRLFLPIDSPFGPQIVIYDLKEHFYAEVTTLANNLEDRYELKYRFPKAGLATFKLYKITSDKIEEISPEKPWPQGTLLLIEAEFLDGGKVILPFKVP